MGVGIPEQPGTNADEEDFLWPSHVRNCQLSGVWPECVPVDDQSFSSANQDKTECIYTGQIQLVAPH